MASQTLTIRRPDDWHVHLRDGEMLRVVAPFTARQFARAIVMPNLAPPVTRIEMAMSYRDRIREAQCLEVVRRIGEHRRGSAVRTVHVEPDVMRASHLGDLPERIDGARAHRTGRADDGQRTIAPSQVTLQRASQRGALWRLLRGSVLARLVASAPARTRVVVVS